MIETLTFWEYAASPAPDHNEWYYFKYTILTLAYFMASTIAIHYICMRYNKVYQDMGSLKKHEYRLYYGSIQHAIVAVAFSTISMWYICGDGKTVFNNDECMNTVRYIHIWALLHTCAYFMFDFTWLFFVLQASSPLDYQTYAHHIIATTTFYQTLYFMDFMTVFGTMLLFVEVSTVFVSMRWLLFTHRLSESKWYGINALMMFFSFLIVRVIFQFYMIFWHASGWIYEEYGKKNISVYQGFVITQMAIMVVLSFVLNAYWFYLMVKMITRVIKRVLSPPKEDEHLETVELVKADALKERHNDEECEGNSTSGSNAPDQIEEEQRDSELSNDKCEVLGMEV